MWGSFPLLMMFKMVASTFPSGCNGCWGHRLGVYGMVAMEIWWLYQWCIVGTCQVNQDVEGDHQWCHSGYWSVVVTFLVICCTFRMFCLWKCNFVISTFDHNNKWCHIGTPDWGPVSTKHLFSIVPNQKHWIFQLLREVLVNGVIEQFEDLTTKYSLDKRHFFKFLQLKHYIRTEQGADFHQLQNNP